MKGRTFVMEVDVEKYMDLHGKLGYAIGSFEVLRDAFKPGSVVDIAWVVGVVERALERLTREKETA